MLKRLLEDSRVTVRRAGPPDPEGRCVVYWMQRAQRADDNAALDIAVRVGNELRLPVVVFLGHAALAGASNLRQLHFLLQGLPYLAERLGRRGVGFVLRPFPEDDLLAFLHEVRAALLVGDDDPLREPAARRAKIAAAVSVPYWSVDADVVVPTRLIGREHFAARTIRPHIHRWLDAFLTRPTEPRARHPWSRPPRCRSLRPGDDRLGALPIDRSVEPASGLVGGGDRALRLLRHFVRHDLPGYQARRNRPDLDATSHLSPYLHSGQIGPRRVALAVHEADASIADKQAFLEELIVRRELAVAYVAYNPRYDSLTGCEPWARRTLAEHRTDQRPMVIAPERLEAAESPDPLWNAAQQQMLESGWMHGWMRMYWGKRLLEWTESPEAAFALAVALNDRYELDGRDPNGYAGVAWAIGGKHDRAFGPERRIFGKIRYMSPAGAARKFSAAAYEKRIAEGLHVPR